MCVFLSLLLLLFCSLVPSIDRAAPEVKTVAALAIDGGNDSLFLNSGDWEAMERKKSSPLELSVNVCCVVCVCFVEEGEKRDREREKEEKRERKKRRESQVKCGCVGRSHGTQ